MKKYLVDFIFITLGAFIAAFSIEGFLIPNSIIDGGILGIAMMTSYVTKISLGYFIFFFNLPFVILALQKFGKTFVLKTFWAVSVLSFSVGLFHSVTSTHKELLATVFGGIILGLGVGLVLRSSAAMDGTEIVAVKLAKKSTFSVGEIIMFFNIFIFIIAGFVYDWDKSMYSLITYFIAYKTIDVVLEGLNETKSVNIISDFSTQIGQSIIKNMNTTVTYIDAKGGYSGTEKKIVYCIVSKLEMQKLKDLVREIDSNAFIAIENVQEIECFRTRKKKV